MESLKKIYSNRTCVPYLYLETANKKKYFNLFCGALFVISYTVYLLLCIIIAI